jgi:hypothetical protein
MASLLGILGGSWQATGHVGDSESTQASCAAPDHPEAFRCNALQRLKIALSLDSVTALQIAQNTSQAKSNFASRAPTKNIVSQLAEFSQPGMGQILLAPS